MTMPSPPFGSVTRRGARSRYLAGTRGVHRPGSNSRWESPEITLYLTATGIPPGCPAPGTVLVCEHLAQCRTTRHHRGGLRIHRLTADEKPVEQNHMKQRMAFLTLSATLLLMAACAPSPSSGTRGETAP